MGDVVVERQQQTFPKLTDAQLGRMARYDTQRHVPAGEVLFDRGSSALGTHVVLTGALEVIRPGILGDEPITVLRAGQFTGEANVLAGRRALVRIFAVGDVRSGSVKRVASAVGEGSVCVQLVHRALAE